MPAEITMPQLSDTMTEGTVVKWLKKEGDRVKGGEIVAEVETDKATMEMESSESGTLAHIAAKEGAKVKVGGVIAVLATGKDNPADVKKQYAGGAATSAPTPSPAATKAASTPSPSKPAPPVAVPVGSSARPGGPGTATLEAAANSEIHERDDIGHGATREPAHPVPPIASKGDGNGHRVFASPLARRIAADKGIDLAQVQGSGPNGRIVEKDVLAFQPRPGGAAAAAGASTGLAPALGTGEKQVIPMTKMRLAIATALLRSKQNIPHFYETIDIDVEELTRVRERINQRLEKENIRLSIADFITRGVVSALHRHPALNARFNAETSEITRYGDVNLGIAVAVPDGLIVPVLRAVNRMGLKEIRQRSSDLVERARAQKLRREEQTEGTFTISSLGTFGIREFSAVINPPEVAILAVGSAEKRPVCKGDQIVARTMLTVTLSADHRVVDGAVAAAFLQTLKQTLEEPGMMLL
jgi:pyruvate dehydrogenase E2 component (dihydrolipoamide acetyltransferase)